MIYCILHETTVYGFPVHDWGVEWDNEECAFPLGFAFSYPPPSVFEEFDSRTLREWSEWCANTEPSNEELKQTDAYAEELLAELRAEDEHQNDIPF